MRLEAREKRREQIAQAAYQLLEEEGYSGISMLKIARKAKASNETLYSWYGDKKGLFKSLVEANANDVNQFLTESLVTNCAPIPTLKHLGPILLKLLTSPRAIALNRAAAADQSGELGQALSAAGRETVMPRVGEIFGRLCEEEKIPEKHQSKLAEVYLRLLLGDIQVRRVTGAIDEPGPEEIDGRAKESIKFLLCILKEAKEWE